MKALSIMQPWAWLIVNRYKPIENRTWPTKHRGPVLIHASKKFDDEGYAWVRKTFPDIQMPEKKAFERGGVVGRATIADCVASHASEWFSGDFGFVMEGASPLPFRPCPGALGFFEIKEAA